MRNPIVLDATLKAIRAAQKVAPAAAAIGTQAAQREDNEDEGTKPPNNDAGAGAAVQPAKSADQDTSGWRHIQTSDKKHYLIHPEDLPKAQQRDANLIIHDQQ